MSNDMTDIELVEQAERLFDADSDEDPARADVDSGLADLRAALSTTGQRHGGE